MKYYKFVDPSGKIVQACCASDFDYYISVKDSLSDDVVGFEIDEKEFVEVNKFLNNDTINDYPEPPIYSTFEKKLMVMNYFKVFKIAPSVKKLDEYFKWLNEQ